MKRKTLLKLTACGLVGALTIGNFTVAAYAAPTAGVASLASDIATTSSAILTVPVNSLFVFVFS